MMTGADLIHQALLIGVIATGVLDLWQQLVHLVFGVPATNWTLVGRWVSHIPRGKLVHDGIGTAASARGETLTGWTAHYAIGVIYAAVYLIIVGPVLGTGPTFLSAIGFGVMTVAAPWFILQPGLGLGILARKAPRPAVVRLHSLSCHAAFGVGLYLGSLVFPTAA